MSVFGSFMSGLLSFFVPYFPMREVRKREREGERECTVVGVAVSWAVRSGPCIWFSPSPVEFGFVNDFGKSRLYLPFWVFSLFLFTALHSSEFRVILYSVQLDLPFAPLISQRRTNFAQPPYRRRGRNQTIIPSSADQRRLHFHNTFASRCDCRPINRYCSRWSSCLFLRGCPYRPRCPTFDTAFDHLWVIHDRCIAWGSNCIMPLFAE